MARSPAAATMRSTGKSVRISGGNVESIELPGIMAKGRQFGMTADQAFEQIEDRMVKHGSRTVEVEDTLERVLRCLLGDEAALVVKAIGAQNPSGERKIVAGLGQPAGCVVFRPLQG